MLVKGAKSVENMTTVNADTNNTNKQVIFKHVALFSDFDLFTEGN